jgi:hypothetical protein
MDLSTEGKQPPTNDIDLYKKWAEARVNEATAIKIEAEADSLRGSWTRPTTVLQVSTIVTALFGAIAAAIYLYADRGTELQKQLEDLRKQLISTQSELVTKSREDADDIQKRLVRARAELSNAENESENQRKTLAASQKTLRQVSKSITAITQRAIEGYALALEVDLEPETSGALQALVEIVKTDTTDRAEEEVNRRLVSSRLQHLSSYINFKATRKDVYRERLKAIPRMSASELRPVAVTLGGVVGMIMWDKSIVTDSERRQLITTVVQSQTVLNNEYEQALKYIAYRALPSDTRAFAELIRVNTQAMIYKKRQFRDSFDRDPLIVCGSLNWNVCLTLAIHLYTIGDSFSKSTFPVEGVQISASFQEEVKLPEWLRPCTGSYGICGVLQADQMSAAIAATGPLRKLFVQLLMNKELTAQEGQQLKALIEKTY